MIKKTSGLLLLFIAFVSGSFCQLNDTVLSTKLTPYLRNYLETTEPLYAINHSQQSLFKPLDAKLQFRPQYLLKMNQRAYLFFYGSGAVYESVSYDKLDSIIRFKRIDNTFNTDYNRGCYFFTHEGRLYNYGGYGFWKSNGTFRVYNFKNREWDVMPVSEEIVPAAFPFPLLWHDLENGSIQVPYQVMINAGIKGEEYYKGKLDLKNHVLDLHGAVWEERGHFSKQATALFTNPAILVQSKKGCWVIKDGNLYLFNFKANRLFRMKDPILTQTFIKIPPPNAGAFVKGDLMYYFDSNLNKYDSLYLDPQKLEELDGEIIENDHYLILLASILLPLLVVSSWLLKKKKRKKTPQNQLLKNSNSIAEITQVTPFNELETSLLKCMISKQTNAQHTTMEDINYILGVKDKTLGLQKKLRSDIINSINEKFRQITNRQEGLIIGIRAKEDKRFVEYQLHPELMGNLEELIKT